MKHAFYIDFFRHFAKEITDGIASYSGFCRKHNVRVPVIFKMKNREQIAVSQFQPLPAKELRASFDILRSNPHIQIDIK